MAAVSAFDDPRLSKLTLLAAFLEVDINGAAAFCRAIRVEVV
jgi:hypothetical protein